MPLEIERTFVVGSLPPEVRQWPSELIEQGYVVITDELEVRLRRRQDRCFETVKTGRGTVRQEIEIELSSEQLDALWPATEGRRIRKRRHVATVDGRQLEVDVFEGGLEGLVLAEVEFESSEDARAFTPPRWFDREVSDDLRYANQSLATAGLP